MKYKVLINIFGHQLEKDEIFDLISATNELNNFYPEIHSYVSSDDRDIQWEIIFSGEGEDFEKKCIKIKNMINSGEFQRSILYDCECDIHNPSAKRNARKVTATFRQIK